MIFVDALFRTAQNRLWARNAVAVAVSRLSGILHYGAQSRFWAVLKSVLTKITQSNENGKFIRFFSFRMINVILPDR